MNLFHLNELALEFKLTTYFSIFYFFLQNTIFFFKFQLTKYVFDFKNTKKKITLYLKKQVFENRKQKLLTNLT